MTRAAARWSPRLHIWNGSADIGPGRISWAGDEIRAVDTQDGTDASRTGHASPAPDLCVIPGLVDTHVHLLGYGGRRGDAQAHDTFTWPLVTPVAEQSLHVAANAQKALRAGVTTLRDLAADEPQAAVMRAFDGGILTGPRLQVSGGVSMTAGHLDLFTPPAVVDRPATADSPDDCRRLVRRYARSGMTGIKIYTSGGVLSVRDKVSWRNGTPAEIEATVDEAHALGMLVACHTHTSRGLQIALDVGADSIEHGSEMTPEQMALLAARGTPVGPTLLVNDVIARGATGSSAEATEAAAAVMQGRNAMFRAAADAGVRFVLATDASGYFVEFGQQWEEVRQLESVLGYGPERALRAATSDAAASIGLGQVTGSLAAGLAADFVVLRGRPWVDAADAAAGNVVAVVSRGVVVAGELPTDPA